MKRRPCSLDEFRGDPRVGRYLDQYTDPSSHYAFATYDQAPIHSGPITAADVLMANLLSLNLRWSAVTPLFATGDGQRFSPLRAALDDALNQARGLPAFELCTSEETKMPLLQEAEQLARSIGPYRPNRPRSWTAVTVSKVLHRLSPNIPLIDSRILNFYCAASKPQLARKHLHEDLVRNKEWMAPIAARYLVRGGPLPLTRMADILIWMDGGSGSSHA